MRPAFTGTARFELVRLLGSGAMGVVYEAVDRERNARVALKALHELDPGPLLRLKQEFRSLQGIVHPNLVNLLDLVHDDGNWFITMELVEGRPLFALSADDPTVDDRRSSADTLPERKRSLTFDEPRLRTHLKQLVEALEALHQAGKIHRDVKPSNVLVTPEGRVVVLDFGLVTDADGPNRSQASHIVGTVAYMAPEQAAGQPLDEAADWYAVGVMLFEALTGQLPITGTPLEILQRKQHLKPPPPGSLVSCSPELSALCAGLLSTDPRKRPRARDILRVLGGGQPSERSWSGRAPTFIGRRDELRQLKEAYQRVRAGSPSAVLVEGPSGVGKSALVRHFAAELRAATPDLVVLAGRYYERETVPYRALDAILDEVSRFLARLPGEGAEAYLPLDAPLLCLLFPSLRAVCDTSLALPALDPHELRSRLHRAVRELFIRLSLKRPLILILDDIQWADPDSQAVLTEALRGPEGPNLLTLATLRTTPGEPAAPSLGSLGGLSHLKLPPLPRDEACLLAARLLGGEATPQAQAIAAEAEGDPLFIDALVRHTLFVGEPRSGPLKLEQAFGEIIRGLEEPARMALDLVALTSGPLTYDLALRAGGFDYTVLTRLATALKAVHLVRGARLREKDALEPYHGRILELTLSLIDEPTRRRRHEQLARAIESLDQADPEAQMVHWRGAGERARAAGYAAAAAERANQNLAFGAAARLYREAIALSDGDKQRLWSGLGDALANGGRGPEAAEAFTQAIAGAAPDEALELRRRIADQLLRSGRIAPGLAAVRDVLASVGLSMPATPRRALAAFLWNRARLQLRGTAWRERAEADVTPADLLRLDACWTVAGVLAMVDTISGAYFQTLHLRLALEAGEPVRAARALGLEAAFLALDGVGNAERSARFIAEATAIADRVGTPYLLGWVRGTESSTAALEGRWRTAEERSREACEIFRTRCGGIAWELGTSQFFNVYSLAYLGRMRELRRRVDENLRDAEERGDLYGASIHQLAHSNMPWLAADNPETARSRVRQATASSTGGRYYLANFWVLLSESDTDLYVGDPERAQERIDQVWRAVQAAMVLRVQLARIEAHHLRGRVLLARAAGAADKRPLLARAQKKAHKIIGEKTPWATPLGQLLLGGAAALEGNADGAVSHLRAAAGGLDAAEMRLYAEAARWRLGKLLGGDEGGALTASSEAWMASEGVVDAARMVRMLAP